jgi:hypothetical protein
MKAAPALAYIAVLLLILFSAPPPVAWAAPGSFSFYNPAFVWQYSNATGAHFFAEGCSWNGLSTTGTGGLFDFSNFYWNLTGATQSRIGFGVDTWGANMTITNVSALSLTYVAENDPALLPTTVRIWCPDLGQPSDVAGAFSWSFDSTWQVLSISSTLDAVVTVTWTQTAVTFGQYVWPALALLSVVLLIIPAVYILKLLGGEDLGAGKVVVLMLYTGIAIAVAAIIFQQIISAL